MAASGAVFMVPELLENTLLQLPLQDLLISKRVSKTSAPTVEGSVKILQALFFKPISGYTAQWHLRDEAGGDTTGDWKTDRAKIIRPILNPFLSSYVAPWRLNEA